MSGLLAEIKAAAEMAASAKKGEATDKSPSAQDSDFGAGADVSKVTSPALASNDPNMGEAEKKGEGSDNLADSASVQEKDEPDSFFSFDLLDVEEKQDSKTDGQVSDDPTDYSSHLHVIDGGAQKAEEAEPKPREENFIPAQTESDEGVPEELVEQLKLGQKERQAERRKKKTLKKPNVKAKKITLPGIPVVAVSSLAAGGAAAALALMLNGGLTPLLTEKAEIAQVDARLVASAHTLINDERQRAMLEKAQEEKRKAEEAKRKAVEAEKEAKRVAKTTSEHTIKNATPVMAAKQPTAKAQAAGGEKAADRPTKTIKQVAAVSAPVTAKPAKALEIKVEEDLLSKSRAALENGDIVRAKTLLEAHIEKHPKDAEAYKYGVQLYSHEGKVLASDVMRMAEKALELDPYDTGTFLVALESLLSAGNADRAIALIETYPYQVRSSAEAASLAGTAYLMAGQYDQAERALERAIDLGVATPDLYYNLGISQEQNGKYDQAIDSWRKAIELAWSGHPYTFDLADLQRIVNGESR